MDDKIKLNGVYFPILVLVISFMGFLAGDEADAAKFLEITNNIVLEDNDISSIVVNPNTNTIYVGHSKACSPVSSITVIDGSSEIVDTEIALHPSEDSLDVCFQQSRHNMALNPETNMIYAIGSRTSVFAINATTNSIAELDVENPNYTGSITLNPITNLIYFSDSYSTIKVIDGSTNQVIATINVNDADISNTLNFQKSTPIIRILDNNYQHQSKFPMNNFLNKGNEIESLQSSGGKLTTINTPVEYPPRLAINPDLNKLYAGKSLSSGFYVVDLETNEIIKNISQIQETGLLHVDPVSNNVYVDDAFGMYVIDGYEDNVIGSFPGDFFQSMATNEITKISYRLLFDQNLIAFDPTTNKVLEIISLEGMNPYLMAINEKTNKIYITTSEGLTVIDGLDEGLTPQSFSPLQQIKNGITLDQIKCKDGLELVIKSSNGSPACVKPESVSKLIERGWASS